MEQEEFQKNRESHNAKRRKGVPPSTDAKTADAGTDGQEELAAAKALTELAVQRPLRGPCNKHLAQQQPQVSPNPASPKALYVA
jgi:hypothetical protein